MIPTWKTGIALALLTAAGCSGSDASNEASEGNAAAGGNAGGAPFNASAPSGNAAAGGQQTRTEATGSILAWSRPAAGSTVSGPVDELVFHFTPPARLSEVTVTGPDGAMPTMVTAVGEVEHYSLPLSGVGPGRYTVDWKASVQGVDHRGSFGFEVR